MTRGLSVPCIFLKASDKLRSIHSVRIFLSSEDRGSSSSGGISPSLTWSDASCHVSAAARSLRKSMERVSSLSLPFCVSGPWHLTQ